MMDMFGRLRIGHQTPKLEAMAEVKLFDNLDPHQRKVLAQYLDEVSVEAGRTLVTEGRRNGTFWIVVAGEADVLVGGELRRRIGPGGWFGATSMLDGRPASATVVSRTPLHALVAGHEQFRALEGNRTVAMRLTAEALERLRSDLAHAS
jgi:CRP-like cAMP-binding protein